MKTKTDHKWLPFPCLLVTHQRWHHSDIQVTLWDEATVFRCRVKDRAEAAEVRDTAEARAEAEGWEEVVG